MTAREKVLDAMTAPARQPRLTTEAAGRLLDERDAEVLREAEHTAATGLLQVLAEAEHLVASGALAVPCEVCPAGTGDPCLWLGQPSAFPHDERARTASARLREILRAALADAGAGRAVTR